MVDSATRQAAAFVPMRTTAAAPAEAAAAVAGETVKIQIQDLNFYYDKFHALKSISGL